MPVYNCERYLKEAVESVLHQTFQDYEFLIVNDGSTDGTPQLLEEHRRNDSRIKIINQANSGIVMALNRGLFAAQGDWIFRMDGDNVARSHRFSAQLKALEKNHRLVLIGGWCQQINADGVPLKIDRYPSDHKSLVRRLERGRFFFPHPGACFRKDVVLKLGGYRERFRHAEDYDLWLRLIGHGEFGCCSEVLLDLRKHGANISNMNYGQDQELTNAAALICHYWRSKLQKDPALMNEPEWSRFLKWIETELEGASYFRNMGELLALRQARWSNPRKKGLRRMTHKVFDVASNRLARKALVQRYFRAYLFLRLAATSIQHFNSFEEIPLRP